MKFMWKKIFSVCLAAAVAFGCLPALSVSAEEDISSDEVAEENISSDEVEETAAQEDAADGELSESDSAQTGEVYWPDAPYVDAECAILMDADTGAILYAKNVDQQMYPASITKIMTTLLALENSSLDETVVFSADAVYKNEGNSSHIARDVDEEMTMEETLYAVMLESANECAYAVAEHVGNGDYQSFIDMMNARAEELGCTNTHFSNANGLPDETHVTTARDMALIAREAIKNAEFRKIIGTKTYVIPPTNKHDESTYLSNHHRMLNEYRGSEYIYEYCIGGKTGYTEAAGNTLVTYAEKDGQLLITVVLRTTTPYDDSIALFDYGFNNFKSVNIAENETRYGGSAGTGGNGIFDSGSGFVEVDPDAQVVLPDGASLADTEVEISYDTAGDGTLGTLTYTYDGRTVGSAELVFSGDSGLTYTFGEEVGTLQSTAAADEEAEQAGSDSRFRRIWNRIWKTRLKWVLVAVVIVIVVLIILRPVFQQMRRRRRRKKRKNGQYTKIKKNRRW